MWCNTTSFRSRVSEGEPPYNQSYLFDILMGKRHGFWNKRWGEGLVNDSKSSFIRRTNANHDLLVEHLFRDIGTFPEATSGLLVKRYLSNRSIDWGSFNSFRVIYSCLPSTDMRSPKRYSILRRRQTTPPITALKLWETQTVFRTCLLNWEIDPQSNRIYNYKPHSDGVNFQAFRF